MSQCQKDEFGHKWCTTPANASGYCDAHDPSMPGVDRSHRIPLAVDKLLTHARMYARQAGVTTTSLLEEVLRIARKT